MKKVKFGKKTQTETPHQICPTAEAVFANNVVENADWFLPLLTVDLQEINPDWRGKAHFVYHEANRQGGIRFKLSGDKYIYDGTYNFDDSGMSERDKGSGYVAMIPLNVPELTAENQSNWPEAVDDAARKAGERLRYKNQFGYRPWWTQHDETPTDPDGEPMLFIGQIRADDYSDEVADSDLYLFFSPKHGIVTQIDQCT